MGAATALPRLILRKVIDYALPPRCPSCGVVVEGDNQFCLPCWSSLTFIGPPWCERCQMPLGDTALDGDWCASCIAEEPPFDRVCAAVAYSPQSAAIALKLKYGRRTGLARLIAFHLERYLPPQTDDSWAIIPVPLHRWRLWERGFNQSLLIARHLGKKSGLPVLPNILQRTKRTRPLKGLSPKQRDKEVRAVFAVPSEYRATIKGRRILLVDDVFTSGATARACARKLKRAGALEVVILCWARVLPGRDALDLADWAPDMLETEASL